MNIKNVAVIILILVVSPLYSHPSSYADAVYKAAANGNDQELQAVLSWQAKWGQQPRKVTEEALSHAIIQNDCRATRILTLTYDRLSCGFLARHYRIFTFFASIVGIGVGIAVAEAALGHHKES